MFNVKVLIIHSFAKNKRFIFFFGVTVILNQKFINFQPFRDLLNKKKTAIFREREKKKPKFIK